MKTMRVSALWLTVALALTASARCLPAQQPDTADSANMLAAAFSEVARSLGPGVVKLSVTPNVSGASDVEQRVADRIGAARGALNAVLKCERVPPQGPERCRLVGADHFVEVPSIVRKGETGIVTVHVYDVVDGELGEAVWKIEVARVDGQWQFSRTIEIQYS